jgi:hypothetical protein
LNIRNNLNELVGKDVAFSNLGHLEEIDKGRKRMVSEVRDEEHLIDALKTETTIKAYTPVEEEVYDKENEKMEENMMMRDSGTEI